MKYPIIICKAGSNYSAHAPDVPGCIATGGTVEETIQMMKDAIAFHFEGLKEDCLPIPLPQTKIEYIETETFHHTV